MHLSPVNRRRDKKDKKPKGGGFGEIAAEFSAPLR